MDIKLLPPALHYMDKETLTTLDAQLVPNYGPDIQFRCYFINRIKSQVAGKGAATRLLKEMLGHTDAMGVPVVETANAYDGDQQKLIDWFMKRGFVQVAPDKYEGALLVHYPPNYKA